MIKFKPWLTIEQVPTVIDRIKGRILHLQVVLESNLKKKPTKKTSMEVTKIILECEEDKAKLDGLESLYNCLKQDKFPKKLSSDIEMIDRLLVETYIKILKNSTFDISEITPHLESRVLDVDYTLIEKTMENLINLYEINLAKSPSESYKKEFCFAILESIAGLYRFLENKDNCFLIKRLGVYENETTIIDMTSSIRKSSKEAFKKFLGTGNRTIEDIHWLGNLKIRKSFEESKENIVKFYSGVHPELGQLAKKVLADGVHINNKSETLYAVDSYRNLPKIIVSKSCKLKDEVGLVHELAHAIHFSLQAANNKITNTEQNTLIIEYVPAFFELLFLFSEYKAESRPKLKKEILDFIIHHFTTLFYSKAFLVEIENKIWLGIGDEIKTPAQMDKIFASTFKEFYGEMIDIPLDNKENWMYQSKPFNPQLDLTYLLAFIYGYHSFIKFQSFRLSPASLLEFLKKGSELDINEIIPLQDIFTDPNKYIKEIIDSLMEYSREN